MERPPCLPTVLPSQALKSLSKPVTDELCSSLDMQRNQSTNHTTRTKSHQSKKTKRNEATTCCIAQRCNCAPKTHQKTIVGDRQKHPPWWAVFSKKSSRRLQKPRWQQGNQSGRRRSSLQRRHLELYNFGNGKGGVESGKRKSLAGRHGTPHSKAHTYQRRTTNRHNQTTITSP